MIKLLTTDQVVEFNRLACSRDKNPHHCNDTGKVQSALHSTYYPGSVPFAHGGIAKVGGALCFYICQAHAFVDGNKRTAMIAATAFMDMNGVSLSFPKSKTTSAFAELVNSCASGNETIDAMKHWFDSHKC